MVEDGGGVVVIVREFDAAKDCSVVEELEKKCEVGPCGELSLFTDLLGDPLCRIRNSPAYLMLVAETVVEGKRELVGMIRGCMKTVTCGNTKLSKSKRSGNNLNNNVVNNNPTKSNPQLLQTSAAVCTKVAYILGLRVSPSHRRMGIGMKLVGKMEEWFKKNGAEYSYIATENDNQASVKLFTHKCGYSKFRTPSILVQPVFAHRIRITNRVSIIKLSPVDAEILYRRHFSTVEFFPRDIDSILKNKLNLGTFLAVPNEWCATDSWPGVDVFLASQLESWAVLSVWNCKDVFKLEVRGASRFKKLFAKTTRVMDRALPWLQLPSVPELFKPFGLHFLYGLGGEGPSRVQLTKILCEYAHNLAKEHGCGVVATEVASLEPLRFGIPHWKRLSCDEDLWCMKRLNKRENNGRGTDGLVGGWIKSPPGLSIFVDPREF